ncbi:LysR substrate-binding domain-containing protein [Burkholderia sp. Ac-20379]|uniref:LysR substrate-binding domain-containing protein n=1 Tax=Burkholderia sp. Ac-20379 TaxID=2703900 RepID=UPI0019811F29|nr:LysR family transcriptional regulator [Burkholderia sp. Ac-20379]
MQIQDTDLKLLRIFATIAQCGGFSAAQSALNIGASGISEYMAQLETRLGLRLCERGRSGFRLTDDGAQLYDAAQRLLGAVEIFHMEAGAVRNRLQGVLRFGLIEATLTDLHSPLLPAIREFGQAAPEVRLDLQIAAPASLVQHVLDGQLHLAVGPFPTRTPGITYTPLYREEQGLYCAATHPLAARADGQVPASELAGCRLAARSYLAEQELALLGLPQAAATVDNVEGRAMLILSGNTIGFLPPHYAKPWVDGGLMIRIDPARYATHLDFDIVTRKNAEPTRVVQAFRECLIAAADVLAGPAAR